MAETSLLIPGQDIRPKSNEKIAIDLVERLYGFKVLQIYELNAYDDKNYHVICDKRHVNPHVTEIFEHGYVLKILNSLDSRNVDFVDAQNQIMLYLKQRDIRSTVPVKNLSDSFYSLEKIQNDSNEGHVVRLLVYQTGLTLHSVPMTTNLLRDVGQFVANLDKQLSNFSHPAFESRSSLWMLSAVPKLRDFLFALKKDDDKKLILDIIEHFENKVLTIVDQLDSGIIHGDLNEQNLLVNAEGTKVDAVIDFGDCHRACLIYELAIAICYMIIQARDIYSAKYVLEGFQSVQKIHFREKSILKICVCARLSQSLTLGAYSYSKDPRNEYLLCTQKHGWDILNKLWPMDSEELLKIWGLDSP